MAAGDTTHVGQTKLDSQTKSQPAASRETNPVDRTPPPGTPNVDSELQARG